MGRPKKNSEPGRLKFSLRELKAVVSKHLLLEDMTLVDVIMAAVVANLLKADPIWLLIIGPPSSGKTELLRALDGVSFTHFLSTMTPQTLISGKIIKGGKTASLLPKLDGKILVLKDFTTILSTRFESRQEILAQLREVYDGRFSKSYGTGESVDWSGHVGFIGACTPVYDSHYGVVAAMGDRFILFRTENEKKSDSGLMALSAIGSESIIRTELKTAVSLFLNQFKNFTPPRFQSSQETKEMVVNLAVFCSYLRCHVERDGYDKSVCYTPQPEGTPRLSKQLYQLGMALAMVRGEDHINSEIYEILKKISLDLLTIQRKSIIKYLWGSLSWEQYSQWSTTADVSQAVNLPTITTKRILEDLMILNVLRRDLQGNADNSGYRWQIRGEITDIIGFSEILPQPKKD
jgi:hypothetical protein